MLVGAGCEGRPLPSQDEGDFGIEDEEEGGDGDGDANTEASGDGDGDSGTTSGTGPVECFSVVDELVIDKDTDPESVTCVERVLGDLTVGPTTGPLDLSMLSNLERVDGKLYFHANYALTKIEGLDKLEYVNWLHVRRNPNLDNLAGFEALTTLNRLTISSNDGLTSLAGLPEGLSPSRIEVDTNDVLSSLDGLPSFVPAPDAPATRFEVAYNPMLVDLAGISDCCSNLSLSLALEGNPALTDLDGLEAFMRLEVLELHDNWGLVDLDGLDNLVEVGDFTIDYDHCMPNASPSLMDLGGAEQLVTIGTLELEQISSLTSLSGLDKVATIDKLFIRNNDALPWSDMDALQTQTDPAVHVLCGGVDAPIECPPEDPCPGSN